MNKTIFNLNSKISITIIACLGIILSFMANAFYVENFWNYILYIFRFFLFVGVYVLIYWLENQNIEFKKKCKIMAGYLVGNALVNICCAWFSVTHILKEIFLLISGLVFFWSIIAFSLEIVIIFVNSKWLNKIVYTHEKIGSILINPIVNIFEKKITND